MTYTVIARDNSTGRLGIGIATYSLAVGASCPQVKPGVGAVSTQAATFAAHGPALLNALDRGLDPEAALGELAKTDNHFEYRQVGVVTAQGAVAVHTGSATRDWAGSLTGEGWLVMGNVLAGDQVVSAMAEALNSSTRTDFAGRILAALEAGRDAGGQRGLDGARLPERSACITVYGDKPSAELDLRVDDHPDAVSEMRRVFDRFKRAESYYADRAHRPGATPPQDQWMREQGLE